MTTANQTALDIVHEQAEDEGLWFEAETAPEAFLQQELRRLHAAIEAGMLDKQPGDEQELSVDFDSRPDTYDHITQVRQFMMFAIMDLTFRGHVHDASKLVAPERDLFDKYTPMLRAVEYGTEEYNQCLAEMAPALAHHYGYNDHHPEHFENGIADMSLIQLLEMVCDWMAAVQRHPHGDIKRSISEINKKRFNYNYDIERLLLNTVDHIRRIAGPAYARRRQMETDAALDAREGTGEEVGAEDA